MNLFAKASLRHWRSESQATPQGLLGVTMLLAAQSKLLSYCASNSFLHLIYIFYLGTLKKKLKVRHLLGIDSSFLLKLQITPY